MKNMALDHPYMELYRQSKLIFCVRYKANWEQECVESLRQISTILYDQQIKAWCDFWVMMSIMIGLGGRYSYSILWDKYLRKYD